MQKVPDFREAYGGWLPFVPRRVIGICMFTITTRKTAFFRLYRAQGALCWQNEKLQIPLFLLKSASHSGLKGHSNLEFDTKGKLKHPKDEVDPLQLFGVYADTSFHVPLSFQLQTFLHQKVFMGEGPNNYFVTTLCVERVLLLAANFFLSL